MKFKHYLEWCCAYVVNVVKLNFLLFAPKNKLLDLQAGTEQENSSIWFALEAWCGLCMNGEEAHLRVSALFLGHFRNS